MKLNALAAVAATAALSAALTAVAMPAAAAVTVSYGAPGAQTTDVALQGKGVETFTGRSGGTFTTDFGTGGQTTGTYSGVDIYNADQYGGAGGTGQYAMTWNSYELKLNTTLPTGVNYFGFWLSALDGGNMLEVFRGNEKLYTLNSGDIINALADNWHYKGNPTDNFKDQDYGEKFVFVNLTSDQSFDRLVFHASGGGFESDNHTVGFVNSGAVPEPATWAMMILGFGGVGAVLRDRRRRIATAA